MLLTQWLNQLSARVLRRRSRLLSRNRHKLTRLTPTAMESLENRVVPTIGVDITAGVVTVTGDGTATDLNISAAGGSYTFNSGSDIFTVITSDGSLPSSGDGTGALQVGNTATPVSGLDVDFTSNAASVTITSTSLDFEVSGGAGSTFQGPNAHALWTLDIGGDSTVTFSSNGANRVVTFNGFENANGGSGNDRMNVDSWTGGELNGGLGNDTVDAQLATDAVVAFGGDGNDEMIGSEFDDTLDGGAGTDRLSGLDGNDVLTGGLGNDTLNGGDGFDAFTEVGVNGNVTITNSKSTDGTGSDSLINMEEINITGDAEKNNLNASAWTLGAVTLNGGEGSDTLWGSFAFGGELNAGDDADDDDTDVIVLNVAGTEVTLSDADVTSGGVTIALVDIEGASLTGGAGNDVIDAVGFTGSATINGGSGDDVITGSVGPSQLNGQAGNDTITGGEDNDSILGGAGNDELDGGEGDNRINGNDGDDTIASGSGNDTITGGVGRDSIDGGDGADHIDGGAGNDTLLGGNGDDTILGGNGHDSLEGNAGADVLNGQADHDRIEGGDDDDTISGGAGNDVLLGEEGDDKINSQSGHDTMLGGDGNDSLTGAGGNELMFGGDGDDFLNGKGGNDTLLGDDGDDSMLGGAGNDLILGGFGGDDTINGQAGKDTVSGGGDQDVIFDPKSERIKNTDESGDDGKLNDHDSYYVLFDASNFEELLEV